MLTLYHYDRSTAAQRVRLGLEEKKIEWNSVVVDTALGDASQRPDDFHQYNPKGLIPLLKDGDFTIPESTLILEYLEDAYQSETKLRPDDPKEIAQMRLWMRKIEDGIHVASRTIGVCVVNRHFYQNTDKKQLAEYYSKMRDGVRKNNDKINTEMGLESPLLLPSIQAFKHLFSDMNKHLQMHSWLAGENYSLADISLVVYLTRLGSFQMAPLWSEMTALNNWFDKIAVRPAYQKAVIDWGDITAEKRRSEGNAAFEEVKKLWQQDS